MAELGSNTSVSEASEKAWTGVAGIGYLFLFGVELEAFIQCAAVLLDMLLLLTPHTVSVLHHLLLDVPKQAGQTHTQTRSHIHTVHHIEKTLRRGDRTDQSLMRGSHSTMTFTCGGPPKPHSFSAL